MKVKVRKYEQMAFKGISTVTKEEQLTISHRAGEIAGALHKVTSAFASEMSEFERIVNENKRLKPILFNSEMVRAILDGRKTQTRRTANINDKVECHGVINNHEFVKDETGFHCHKCGFGVVPPHSRYPVGTSFFRPRYNVGDYLYVRETWGDCDGNYILYRADYPNGATTYDFGDGEHICDLPKWHPSLHMPKEAARIFLRVTGVRCERLQDIDEDGARMEGVDIWDDACQDEKWHPTYYDPDSGGFPSFINGFISLWNSTVKPSDLDKYGWNANPWVWVYEFERVEVENG